MKIRSIARSNKYKNILLAPDTTNNSKCRILKVTELRKLSHENYTETNEYDDLNNPNDDEFHELNNNIFNNNEQRPKNLNESQLKNQLQPYYNAYNRYYIIKSHMRNRRILKWNLKLIAFYQP